MSAPRVVSRSCRLFSSSFTTRRIASSISTTTRTTVPKRQFISSTRVSIDTVQTPSRGEEVSLTENYAKATGNNASGIALLKLPKEATKSDIEALLKSRGYDIKKLQVHVDRFTFNNNAMAFAELGNEQQAQDFLGEMQLLDQSIYVRPMKSDFEWGSSFKSTKFGGSRFFLDEGNAAQEAVRPIIEGRRMMLAVQTPGWGGKDEVVSTRNRTALKIIEKYFGSYGVECVSGVSPFYGDKQEVPRMLCFMDFQTKEGADSAVEDLHDTEIEGRLTWLKRSRIAAWRAHQIGKVSQAVLAELQEKGLAPQETYENKFWNRKEGMQTRKYNERARPESRY